MCHTNSMKVNYTVEVPAAPFENQTFATLDECWDSCYDLSEEYGYAKVMYGKCLMGEYGDCP